ncbi:hypothetical protein HZA56_17710 [Candidatus Poribacteria bacterium]|nr:hypothetical protein [Candidatus Poribacteria bacterium]
MITNKDDVPAMAGQRPDAAISEETGQTENGMCRSDFWKWRKGWRREDRNIGLPFGVSLIAMGMLWLATVAGWFKEDYFWPTVLSGFGAWMAARHIICGIPLIVGGLLWLGEIFKLFEPAYYWPLFVTIVGTWIVALRLVRKRG